MVILCDDVACCDDGQSTTLQPHILSVNSIDDVHDDRQFVAFEEDEAELSSEGVFSDSKQSEDDIVTFTSGDLQTIQSVTARSRDGVRVTFAKDLKPGVLSPPPARHLRFDESPVMKWEKEISTQRRWFWVSFVVIVLVGAIVPLSLLLSKRSSTSDGTPNPANTEGGRVPVDNTTIVQAPMASPTVRACFESYNELAGAVDAYALDTTNQYLIDKYGAFEEWCITPIANLSYMFSPDRNPVLYQFEGNVTYWDTSNVATLQGVFRNNPNVNIPLHWDTGAVTDMSAAFESAYMFNQPLEWEVQNVRDMSTMFRFASSFNQPLNTWVLATSVDLREMFRGASSFRQDLCGFGDTLLRANTANMFVSSNCESVDDPVIQELPPGPFCKVCE